MTLSANDGATVANPGSASSSGRARRGPAPLRALELVRIVTVLELAVLDLGEGALG